MNHEWDEAATGLILLGNLRATGTTMTRCFAAALGMMRAVMEA
jgi:hypothetical protein